MCFWRLELEGIAEPADAIKDQRTDGRDWRKAAGGRAEVAELAGADPVGGSAI